MYQAVDAYKIGHQPRINYNLSATVPFLLFQLMVGFFLVSVFLAILIDTFNQIREEMNEQALLSPEQREWVNALELIASIKPTIMPRAPKNAFANYCFALVSKKWVSYLSMLLSGANFIVFASQHARPSPLYKDVLFWSSLFFLIAYISEACVKLIGLSPPVYFSKLWNRVDFVVVLGCIIEISTGYYLPVCVFRMLRVASFFEKRNDLRFRIFYRTIVHAIPSLIPVATLLIIVFFVYGFIGVLTFGDVNNGSFIDETFNFRSFFNALMTMGVIVSGDQWTDIISDCLTSGFDCNPNEYGCGSKAVVYTFFVSFQFFIAFILLNLFATVILESYGHMNISEESAFQLYHCNQYKRAWACFDPDATGMIPKSHLVDLLRLLGPPLGIRPGLPAEDIEKLLDKLNVPTTASGHIMFHFTLHAITQHLVGTELPSCQLVHNLEANIYQIYDRQGSTPAGLKELIFTSLRQITRGSTQSFLARNKNATPRQMVEPANEAQLDCNPLEPPSSPQAATSNAKISTASSSYSFVRSVQSSELTQIEMTPLEESQIHMDFQANPAPCPEPPTDPHDAAQLQGNKSRSRAQRTRLFSSSASHLSIIIPSNNTTDTAEPADAYETQVSQFTPIQATPAETQGFPNLDQSFQTPQPRASCPPTPDVFLPHQALSDSIRTANRADASSRRLPKGATASASETIRSQPAFSPLRKRKTNPSRLTHPNISLAENKARDEGTGVSPQQSCSVHPKERVLPEPVSDPNRSQDNTQQPPTVTKDSPRLE